MKKEIVFREIKKVLDTFQKSNFESPEARRCLSELIANRVVDAVKSKKEESLYVNQAMDDCDR